MRADPADAADRRARRGAVLAPVLIAALLVPVGLNLLRSGDADASLPADARASEADTGPPPLAVEADAAPGGDGSADRPYRSIQQAVERAVPGQTIEVTPGRYTEPLRSVQPGRPDAPITIVGDGAVIAGDDDTEHLVEITHDHVVLQGLELRDASTLVSITGATGVRIVENRLHDAEGECLRIRYQSVGNEVAGNHISECGVEDFDLAEDAKNGEGVYIGTAPEQLDDNPTDEPDRSNANHVHDNRIAVPAECVDVKEHAQANIIENNVCTGSRDPDGAGFSSRGIGTVLQGNRSTGNAGAGIRLGGDTEQDGIGSVVRGNVLRDNDGYGLRVASTPQRLLCGNEFSGNGEGPSDLDHVDPARPC